MAEQKKGKLSVKISEDKESGVYSNAVSVHVNTNETIIDFGYILPNVQPTTIKLLQRINMNHKTAESFMNVLSNAMLDFRNKQEK